MLKYNISFDKSAHFLIFILAYLTEITTKISTSSKSTSNCVGNRDKFKCYGHTTWQTSIFC